MDHEGPGRTVGDVARLTGVSVRTLHHYDQIGLLAPSGRSAGGYRLYQPGDLTRLRHILGYRALGFPLAEIAMIMAAPDTDARDHLRRQHRLLREQISRRQDMLARIEKELEARLVGVSLTPEEQFEIFGTDQVGGAWADEAEQTWGGTDAWRESQRRAARYGRQDWTGIKAEADAINRELAAALAAGLPPDGPRARELAERHRQHIVRWFYDCGHTLHRGLAGMCLEDGRFGRTLDALAPGLARYLHDAIQANADQAAG